VSALSTTQQSLLLDVDALVAALLGDTSPEQVTAIVDRLEAAADYGNGISPGAVDEVRTAIRLVRSRQPCAGIDALLAVRSELS
jgi:hypothetical protein